MSQKDLLGGKGANLAEMVRIGLPVPPGFTITTHACRQYLQSGKFPETLNSEMDAALKELEKQTGKKFGGVDNPLLVSVRSGAKFSMPGMMQTVLNVGMTPEVTESLAASSGNPRFAWDSYRRFIEMYGKIVCDIAPAAITPTIATRIAPRRLTETSLLRRFPSINKKYESHKTAYAVSLAKKYGLT
jgi:pyruvate,orthophosphate dikinase